MHLTSIEVHMKRRYSRAGLGLSMVAGLAASLAVAPGAAAQQVQLRLKGSPGDTSAYSVALTQSVLLVLPLPIFVRCCLL